MAKVVPNPLSHGKQRLPMSEATRNLMLRLLAIPGQVNHAPFQVADPLHGDDPFEDPNALVPHLANVQNPARGPMFVNPLQGAPQQVADPFDRSDALQGMLPIGLQMQMMKLLRKPIGNARGPMFVNPIQGAPFQLNDPIDASNPGDPFAR